MGYKILCLSWGASEAPLDIDPISQGVLTPSHLIPPQGSPRRDGFRPHVNLYKLGLFRNWAHMLKIGQKSRKLSEISRFQNFEKLRFCLTLTHMNCHNSVKFWDREILVLFLCVLKFMLSNLGSTTSIFIPPPQGGGGRVKNLKSNFVNFFIFNIQEKSKCFKWW